MTKIKLNIKRKLFKCKKYRETEVDPKNTVH